MAAIAETPVASAKAPPQEQPLLRVIDLTKDYVTRSGGVVTALPGVTLDLADGEFVCIVGPSGWQSAISK